MLMKTPITSTGANRNSFQNHRQPKNKNKTRYKQKWSKLLKRNASHIRWICQPMDVINKDLYENAT